MYPLTSYHVTWYLPSFYLVHSSCRTYYPQVRVPTCKVRVPTCKIRVIPYVVRRAACPLYFQSRVPPPGCTDKASKRRNAHPSAPSPYPYGIRRPWCLSPRLRRVFMVDISTVETVPVPKTSALETPRRQLSEDLSFDVGTLLVVEQSSLENRPRGVIN